MNSNATNKTRTGPKRVRTQEPEEEQDTQKSPPSSTPSSPTKAAKNALELAVASLDRILTYGTLLDVLWQMYHAWITYGTVRRIA